MSNAFSRAAFACLALAALAVGEARGEEACGTSYDHLVTLGHELIAANPGATFTDYAGDDARKIVAKMNAVEPVSDWAAEHIVVIDPDGEQPFRVGIVDQGCMTHAFPIPREAWLALLGAALGDRS